MIVLKSDYFSSHERLTRFINENHIKREDIFSHYAGSKLLYHLFLCG